MGVGRVEVGGVRVDRMSKSNRKTFRNIDKDYLMYCYQLFYLENNQLENANLHSLNFRVLKRLRWPNNC